LNQKDFCSLIAMNALP